MAAIDFPSMGSKTQPVFFVGSGRSGTRSIYKLLSGTEDVDIHHEYACTHIQPVAACYAMERCSFADAADSFRALHATAVHYADSRFWIDCSNKLSWLIEPILSVLPNAKFVLICRDGRKVASSFFHKLSDEMYDDRSVAILASWLKDPVANPKPPPEKKYWWNIPQPGQEFYEDFSGFNRFERCCYHWRQANKRVLHSFESLSREQCITFRLEDLIMNASQLEEMFNFVGLPYEQSYHQVLQTPQNVIFPMDFKLDVHQREAFDRIAGDLQAELGYSASDEYEMKY